MIKRLLATGLLSTIPLGGQSIDDTIIPGKSAVFVSLQQTLNTRSARSGDKFSSQVEVPVTAHDRIVIPVGSYIIGYVDKSKRAGRIKGKAELTLKFDTVILPDGTTRYMRAGVQTSEGYATDLDSEEGTIQSQGGGTGEVLAGAAGGAVTGTIVGVTAGAMRGGMGRGAAAGAAVGAAVGGLMALFKRGEDVVLPRGSTLTIQLQEDVHFERPVPRLHRRPLGGG